MSRRYGLTQRERLHLNNLRSADYRSLHYHPRKLILPLLLSAALWVVLVLAFLWAGGVISW